MAKNIDFMGAIFPDVPSVKLPQQGGGLVAFDDTTDATATADKILQGYTAYANGQKLVGTASGGITPSGTIQITQNGQVDVTQYAIADVNVSGGGDSRFDLFHTISLGTISTTSTSETFYQRYELPSIDDYDALFSICTADTVGVDCHAGTTSITLLSGRRDHKDASIVPNHKINYFVDASGIWKSFTNGTAYGVYTKYGTYSSKPCLNVYTKYNSNYTKTINSTYTMRVYGLKLWDLFEN